MAESREHPMHVGGLSLFEPPEGAGPEFVREFTDAMVANDEFQPTFRKRPATIMGGIAPLAWAYDDEIDVDAGRAGINGQPQACFVYLRFDLKRA